MRAEFKRLEEKLANGAFGDFDFNDRWEIQNFAEGGWPDGIEKQAESVEALTLMLLEHIHMLHARIEALSEELNEVRFGGSDA